MTLLENEVRRCTRYKHNMSVIMLDIDDFKLINDSCGHLVGDQILREVSNQILTTVRKIDVAARYGGEEFVILLPETTKQGASIIAERLRKNIANLKVNTNDDRVVTTTVSMGIAQFPNDAITAQDIIDAADKALYHSKRNGKNVVSLYGENENFVMVDKYEV